jgi:hypothetical protein
MKLPMHNEQRLVAAVAGTAGTAHARGALEAVLSQAAASGMAPAHWSTLEIQPGPCKTWRGEPAQLLAVTSWPAGGPLHAAGRKLRAVCRLLAEQLPADGLLVLNGDDPELARASLRTSAPIVHVGQQARCEIAPRKVRWHAGRLLFELAGQQFCVPAPGTEALAGVLAAVGVGWRLGLSWAEMARALGGVEPPPRRCQALPLKQKRGIRSQGRQTAVAGQILRLWGDLWAGAGWQRAA